MALLDRRGGIPNLRRHRHSRGSNSNRRQGCGNAKPVRSQCLPQGGQTLRPKAIAVYYASSFSAVSVLMRVAASMSASASDSSGWLDRVAAGTENHRFAQVTNACGIGKPRSAAELRGTAHDRFPGFAQARHDLCIGRYHERVLDVCHHHFDPNFWIARLGLFDRTLQKCANLLERNTGLWPGVDPDGCSDRGSSTGHLETGRHRCVRPR